MRSFTTVLASASLFAVSALASPGANWGQNWGPWKQTTDNHGHAQCLSDADAQQVADNFRSLIADYHVETANAVLTEDFTDYSDGVIELINSGCPNSPIELGTATFNNRTAFEAGQGSQPNIPFQALNIWHNCDVVTLRWVSYQQPGQVTGIIVLETVYQNDQWLIQTVYSEFNSGAWLVNLGIFKPQNCSAGH